MGLILEARSPIFSIPASVFASRSLLLIWKRLQKLRRTSQTSHISDDDTPNFRVKHGDALQTLRGVRALLKTITCHLVSDEENTDTMPRKKMT